MKRTSNRLRPIATILGVGCAAVLARAAIAQPSENFDLWATQCYELQGQEALDACNRALEIDPNEASLWTNRGTKLGRDLGRYREAITSFDRAIALEPEYSLAHYNRCVGLVEMKQYEQAVSSCDLALQGNGRWGNVQPAWAWDMKGFAFSKLGRYEESLAAREQALALDPDDPQTWYNRGVVLSQLGRYQDAIASYDRALSLDADFTAAQQNRDTLRQRLNN